MYWSLIVMKFCKHGMYGEKYNPTMYCQNTYVVELFNIGKRYTKCHLNPTFVKSNIDISN